jgi:uncharacterized membrane protein
MVDATTGRSDDGARAQGDGRPPFAELAADALRYWEPRRLLYNLALTAVVVAHLVAAWPASRALLTRDTFFGTFFLAVLANVLYCAAYAVDLFVQYSGLRAIWPRRRWILLTVGTCFAAVITHFISIGALASGGSR